MTTKKTDENAFLALLFDYHLEQTALRFGLIDNSSKEITDEDATKLLNFAEVKSLNADDKSKILSFLICALLWENRKPHWEALQSFLTRIFVRIGLGTSAKMVNWNEELASFWSLGSYLDELYSTQSLISHEEKIGDLSIILSSFQKRMWDAIGDNKRIGISAPTSAGKSFVLVHKAIDILNREDGTVVFIVPTLSLINQVSNDLRKLIKEVGIKDISIYQTVNNISLFKSRKIVYVLTQERVLNALNNQEIPFEDVKLLVIDEVQNVEKVSNEDEERSKTLFDAIQDFKHNLSIEKIVISGPRLGNISDVVKLWFGEDSVSVSEELPSVVNISYTFKKIHRVTGKLEFSQYLPLNFRSSIIIDDLALLRDKVLGKKMYGDEVHSFILKLIRADAEAGNIIFTGRTKQAADTAKFLAEHSTQQVSDELESLAKFVAFTVHPDYTLSKTIAHKVAYHHGKVPPHLRSIVEKTFSKKIISTVVSTTTLMQGVNLPAKNIIIRNPSVGTELLTGYEFTNLKGRAGRLMKDLVGRAIIIDEKECTDANIEVSTSAEKILKAGYGERFQQERSYIEDQLKKGKIMDLKTMDQDIVIYVRNIALKYGNDGMARLIDSGITISKGLYEEVNRRLEELEVPREICIEHPYWDPLILNELFLSLRDNNWPAFPTNVFHSSSALIALIQTVNDHAPLYVQKYLGILPDTEHGLRKITSLCITAESYASGKPLNEVINPATWPISSEDDIDNRISDLKYVIYGITKLLRPVFGIYDFLNSSKTTAILGFIESGSYNTNVRVLMEMGIPRETAIAMQDLQNNNYVDSDGQVNDKLLLTFIQKAKVDAKLDYWHRMLLEDH